MSTPPFLFIFFISLIFDIYAWMVDKVLDSLVLELSIVEYTRLRL